MIYAGAGGTLGGYGAAAQLPEHSLWAPVATILGSAALLAGDVWIGVTVTRPRFRRDG